MRNVSASTVDLRAIAAAFGAAALFGASTPIAKALVAGVHPVVLAGLLYLGSGIGLLAFRARAWLRPGGTGLAIGAFGEPTTSTFWLAAALMGAGVWLHLTERHEHRHTHAPLEHAHPHTHDEHHRHEHEFAWDGREPHAHSHRHAATTHSHPHYPDLHHRHSHGRLAGGAE